MKVKEITKALANLLIIALLITTVYLQKQNISNANKNIEEIKAFRKEVRETSEQTRKTLEEFGIKLEDTP